MDEQTAERLKIGSKMIVLFSIISFMFVCLYNFAIKKDNQFFNDFDEKTRKLKANWGKIIGYSILFGVILMIVFMIIGEIQIRNTKRYGRCYPYTIYKIFGEDVFCDQD